MKEREKARVLMIGPARSVHGGVSAVVNNYYAAGLDGQITLKYIATMVDGSRVRKLIQAIAAYLHFLAALPFYDILHVNMAADASCYRKMLFINTAWFFKKKILIHEHGGDFEGFYYGRCREKQRRRISRALNRADLFLVLSQGWKDFFEKIISSDKIQVLENGIFIPDMGKADYSSHSVLFLGRLCREKGIGELLKAVPLIQKQIPDLKLILGGVWEENSGELKEKAEALYPIVECLGWISPAQREKMMEECSIFVLPTWFEGQPISLLEAMAKGMCVVTSAVGGIPQIMGRREENNGCLLPPQNTDALADALTALLKEEALRREMGQNARRRMIAQYDIHKRVEILIRYYQMLKG